MDDQTRVMVIPDLVPTPKGVKFSLIGLRRDAYGTTVQSFPFT